MHVYKQILLLMTYHRVYDKSDLTGVTNVSGTAHHYGIHDIILGFCEYSCCSGSLIARLLGFVPCCDGRYNFRLKRCTVRLYIHLSCRRFTFYLYLLTYNGVQHAFHMIWCSYRLTATPMVQAVQQELPTLPEYMLSPPVFSDVRVARVL